MFTRSVNTETDSYSDGTTQTFTVKHVGRTGRTGGVPGGAPPN
jgi:hypothetical protein